MKKKPKAAKEYEELGRTVERIAGLGYPSKKQLMKASFLKGIFGGLGGVIGATVILALLVWLLSLLGEVPLIGRLFDNARETISQ